MKRFLLASVAVLALATVVPVSVSAQTSVPTFNSNPNTFNYTVQGGAVQQSSYSPQVSGGISSCSNLKVEGVAGVVSCIIGFFNYATYLIMAFSVLYIVWGAYKFMTETGREEGRNIMLYGIIGLFVMVSIWGLVNILDNTFKLSGQDARKPPQLIAPN